ncbi:phage portal protein [Pararhodobacter oceanensis]|uniref:phage portal protein n=1 Tax=Pararhodobacter oceanensis TaxID=2172121 RepID=UPI003A92D2A4
MFDFFRKPEAAPVAVPEAKASAVGPLTAGGVGRMAGVKTATQPVWTARNTVSLTRAGFQNNPVGFRAVRLISEAAAALPLVLQSPEQRFDQHPLLTLLRRPNPAQGRAEFLEAIYAQLLLSGSAYIEAVNGGDTPLPSELHVLRADRMRVVPGADGWPAAYDYAVGGRKHRFVMGEGAAPICHLRAYHPLDDHYGLSPIEPAAAALDVHSSASRWSKALLDNAARPSGAIVFRGEDGQGAMTQEQFTRLQDEMEMHHQGARNAGRPMLLEGGLDWKPMGFSPSDMEFHKTKEAAAREIALAFGVPPMLLGMPGDATYANYQEANRGFYRLTILPLAAKVTDSLAHWLSVHAGEALELKPDLDQVPALAVERDQQWRRVAEADFLSEAEKRALLGLPPRPEGV